MIRISEQTYARLQKLATPFVDTPATVIDKVLDFYEKAQEAAGAPITTSPEPDARSDTRRFNAEHPPDLHHTRFIQGVVNGVQVKNWNRLLDEAHRAALSRGATKPELCSDSLSNVIERKETTRGFRHLSDLGISIQGVDAGSAWAHAHHLARRYGFSIRAEFEWREKAGAAFPGEAGTLAWTP